MSIVAFRMNTKRLQQARREGRKDHSNDTSKLKSLVVSSIDREMEYTCVSRIYHCGYRMDFL